jgi:hypothetical protein
MLCEVCGDDRFDRVEYPSGISTVPAFACVRCGEMVLSEDAAKTEEERSSVRIAIAARAVTYAGPESR